MPFQLQKFNELKHENDKKKIIPGTLLWPQLSCWVAISTPQEFTPKRP